MEILCENISKFVITQVLSVLYEKFEVQYFLR